MTKNINGEFLNVLQNYEGTVDDRRKKFLVENYGFSDDRSVVTMEHEVLGDLGYTGSINDRWSKYLKALGGTGLSAKASLLSSTFYLGYSVGGVAPNFVSDFEKDKYLVDKTYTDFDSALTFSRSGLATMTDSDGNLKWAPHNLLRYSEDFTDADWSKIGGTVTSNAGVAPDNSVSADRWVATSSARVLLDTHTFIIGGVYTVAFWVKSFDGTSQNFRLFGDATITSSEFTATSDWQLFEFEFTVVTGGSKSFGITDNAATDDYDVLIWGAHLYRSDLGGMVNNPERGDSYVPTAGSAVYMPRTGHHVWNGSQWVNEGLLIESEARTNLIPHSEDRTDAGWTNSSVAVSDDGTTINGLAASKMTYDGSAANFSEGLGAVSGTSVALSAFVARGDLDDLGAGHRFGFYDTTATANIGFINFDYGTGETSVQSGTVTDHGAVELEDGWRLWMVVPHTSGNGLIAYFGGVGSATNAGYTYLAGPQVEAASTPSSYIPTSGSTVTRSADTLTAPSANLPWSSTAISIAMEGLETYADEDTAGQVTLYDRRVDANNRITLTLDTDSTKTGTFTLTLVNGGSTETISTTGEITPGVNKPFNLAFVATSTELGIALNGTAETRVSHTLGLPDLSGADATYEGMGARALVREWADDVDEAEASS